MKKIIGILCQMDDIPGVLRAVERVRRRHSSAACLVAMSSDIAERVQKLGHPCRTLSSYGEKGDIHRRTVLWLDQWADRPIQGGTSLKERFIARGVSFWWFAMPLLFPDLRRCVRLVDGFSEVFDAESPDLIVAAAPGSRPILPFRLDRSPDLPARIAVQVARSRGCELLPAPGSKHAGVRFWVTYCVRRLLVGAYGWGGEYWWGKLRVWVAGLATPKSIPPAHVPGRCLLHFSTPAYWRASGEDDASRHDVFAGALLSDFSARPGWRVLDVDTEVNLPSLKSLRKLWEKARRPGVSLLPMEAVYDRGIRRRAADMQGELRQSWRALRGGASFSESLQYRGVRLWPVMQGRFNYAFEQYSGVALTHLEAVYRLMEKERPAAVTLEFEEGSYGRSAIAAGQQLGTPTLALQHGILTDPHIPSYFYTRVSTARDRDPLGCPIATRTAVFGEVTRRQLTTVSAYPEEAVAVTGSAAFDPLARARDGLDRAGARQTLGLPPTVRVVTVMSHRFLGPEYWQWFMETVFSVLRELPDWHLVIKLHPNDGPERYLEAAERAGLSRPLVLRDRLWPAIVAADAVIACYTTTILDALALKRPVVFPVIPGMEDALGFSGSGGVIPVEDAEQLAAALCRLGAEPAYVAQQVARAEPVLEEHLYRVDGLASDRLARLVDEIIVVEQGNGPRTEGRLEVVEHA